MLDSLYAEYWICPADLAFSLLAPANGVGIFTSCFVVLKSTGSQRKNVVESLIPKK
jgi:hypothetical protein